MKLPLSIASASLLLALNAQAALVFQADFNGTGSGTGGVSDIVSFGGTGAITNANPEISKVTASVSSVSALAGGGSYLSLNDEGLQTGTRAAGVAFTPTSAANSFDSWYANTSTSTPGSHDTLNGGFDFLFRTSSSATLLKDTFRFFDINGGNTAYRLALSTIADNKLSLALNQNGTNIVRATSEIISISANTTYRIAGTLSTDASGFVTVSLYLAEGDTVIDSSSATHLVASGTSAVVLDSGNSISSSFGSTAGFTFGMTSNSDADSKVLDLDSFRIYDSVPANFASLSNIPEPGSFALVMGGLVGAGVCVIRRRR